MIQVFQRRERCPFCLCGAVYAKEEICLCNVCNGAIWITKVRWVTTADLQDAGTNLVLDASQITAETTETVERHATGLASFV